MEPSNEQEVRNENNQKRTVLVVILILLLANAFLLWQFFNKKQENQVLVQDTINLTAQKDSITAEYKSVKAELDKLQIDNLAMQSKLTENDEQIKAQTLKIEKLMRVNAGIGALRAEVKKLKDMKTQYESKIADLEKQNIQLASENKDLNNNLSTEKSKNENLSKENQGLSNKVALGSILKADDISVSGVRFKSSGKEIVEKKAKNVQKIKTCFSILDNLVVDKGQKNVYVRVLGPDKSLLSTSSGTFTYNGQQIPYTQIQEINYANKRVDQCVYWEKGSSFAKGKYSMELFCEGNMIGNGEFELK